MDNLTADDKELLTNLHNLEELSVIFKLLDIAVADKAKAVLAASLVNGTEDLIYRKAAYDGARSLVQEVRKVIEAGKGDKRVRGRRK